MSELKNMSELKVEEVWDITKRNFKIGKDYIETETDEYIVFCPFNYSILTYFYDVISHKGGYFKLQHCVTRSLGAFCFWYNRLYVDGRLKTFFIRKDINLMLMASEQDKLAEFTGWIDFNDRNFLYFAHDVNNDLISGEYHNYEVEYAYSRKIVNKDLADKVNVIASQVHDDLFAQYDVHINELEETLHNIIDEF